MVATRFFTILFAAVLATPFDAYALPVNAVSNAAARACANGHKEWCPIKRQYEYGVLAPPFGPIAGPGLLMRKWVYPVIPRDDSTDDTTKNAMIAGDVLAGTTAASGAIAAALTDGTPMTATNLLELFGSLLAKRDTGSTIAEVGISAEVASEIMEIIPELFAKRDVGSAVSEGAVITEVFGEIMDIIPELFVKRNAGSAVSEGAVITEVFGEIMDIIPEFFVKRDVGSAVSEGAVVTEVFGEIMDMIPEIFVKRDVKDAIAEGGAGAYVLSEIMDILPELFLKRDDSDGSSEVASESGLDGLKAAVKLALELLE